MEKTRTIPLTVEEAFNLFTNKLDTWWPLDTHSVTGQEDGELPARVVFGHGVGEQVVEITRDGTRHVWADILVWEPPHRLSVSWYPGSDPSNATTFEVTFTPHAEGSVLHLTHHGWAADSGGQAHRERYQTGWEMVLDPFAAATEAAQRS